MHDGLIQVIELVLIILSLQNDIEQFDCHEEIHGFFTNKTTLITH